MKAAIFRKSNMIRATRCYLNLSCEQKGAMFDKAMCNRIWFHVTRQLTDITPSDSGRGNLLF